VPLPPLDLDDRTWADLVDEARATIPNLAAAWTDHNVHDPGITLVELLAWLVEQDIYRVNRVPERHRRAFLRLAGFVPAPPRPARVVLALGPGGPLDVPAGTRLTGSGLPFRTLTSARVSDAVLQAVQVFDGSTYEDVTAAWRDRLGFLPLGPDPSAGIGPALCLGFDPPPPAGAPLTLWLEAAVPVTGTLPDAPHHDARCVWEAYLGSDWTPAVSSDRTRALTLSGAVRLTPPAQTAAVVGAVPVPLTWIRCRLAAGRHDEPPRLTAIVVHAVTAAQVAPVRRTFPIARGVQPATGAVPVAGVTSRLRLAFDGDGHVTSFATSDDPSLPRVAVLDHRAETADASGALSAELVLLGRGSGRPGQRLRLPGAPVAHGRARIWLTTADGGASRRVRLVPDLGTAGPRDDHAMLDAQSGELRFGDGLHGRAPAAGAVILAAYDTTLAGAGNVAPDVEWAGPVTARNPLPAGGGADAEDLGPPVRRASATLWAHERLLELSTSTLDGLPRAAVLDRPAPPRLVTGVDAERLAFATPGVHVRRARAWAGVDGRHPGLAAPGTLTVVVLGALAAARPEPTRGLIAAVARFLGAHRTLGTRVRVVGPVYVAVDLSVVVVAQAGADHARVGEAVSARLRAFLHPLHGGVDAHGWPFGRDVARGELLAVVRRVAGVDHVDELVVHGCGRDRCDVLPMAPTALPDLTVLSVEVRP
jgi:predicted phage baseplate assembly protein